MKPCYRRVSDDDGIRVLIEDDAMSRAVAYTCGMLPGPSGAFRLFRAFGIDVFLHWTWFVFAAFVVQFPPEGWSGLDRLVVTIGVFAIVLMHEFGHALACRSVGGRAERIVLWPLGGVAYVQPPQRAGAMLWSIVAGPLVNVVLVPVFFVAMWTAESVLGESSTTGLLGLLFMINLFLLIFNMLPVYPLDGGQTLQALLWFVVGRVKALRIAASIGVVVGVLAALALLATGELWLMMLAIFVAWRSLDGIRLARVLARAEAAGIPIEDPRGATRRPWPPH